MQTLIEKVHFNGSYWDVIKSMAIWSTLRRKKWRRAPSLWELCYKFATWIPLISFSNRSDFPSPLFFWGSVSSVCSRGCWSRAQVFLVLATLLLLFLVVSLCCCCFGFSFLSVHDPINPIHATSRVSLTPQCTSSHYTNPRPSKSQ